MNLCFAVDRSLGSLARWLRILGFDTAYGSDISSSQLSALLKEHRILITRTKKIQKMFESHPHVFITSDSLFEQLKQIVDHLGIHPDDIRQFSRCIHCNLVIDEVDKKDVYGRVPDYIWETHDEFHSCRQCGRIYWSGSHTERIADKINQIFDSLSAQHFNP
jgi:uncharacterized protein with PIN domain